MQTLYATRAAHLYEDECGAPELFSGGCKIISVDEMAGTADAGKVTPTHTHTRHTHTSPSPPPPPPPPPHASRHTHTHTARTHARTHAHLVSRSRANHA